MKKRKLFNNVINLFSGIPRVNKTERSLLMDAVNKCNGEIAEPANDDNATMEIIVNLYNKKLVEIDCKKDKLFVSEFGKSILLQN